MKIRMMFRDNWEGNVNGHLVDPQDPSRRRISYGCGTECDTLDHGKAILFSAIKDQFKEKGKFQDIDQREGFYQVDVEIVEN